ncbi:hypothetical protein EIN_391360 [Entamoeba invadens IP1]|uniref:EamA domain-containing protein n=1 Tax=Entamoeba invadens IP1 TaxID=370355 RepID=A0A0A1UBA1_ENTIV|nr:hypothetical protein EIN_391360 [Entamoeba invadens IP1]ELP89481.1 hypothetical protein EIN_391360 [Entamoeba invadens IP1]|eukprot:XP_004256252.1 hypothetical protein EIN_391360 [Entamoeba invadens IP1]
MGFVEKTKELWELFYEKYLVMTVVITVFLLTGTATTILSKTAYQLEGEGVDGDIHKFEKPLFLNWAMFLGMTLCLFIYFFQFYVLPLFKKTETKKESMNWKGYLLMLIPAFCDFLATYLMNFGLIWVSSSIFQMMRGSIIVFTAILAVFYRKQKMYMFEIIGVLIIVVSLCLIGTAAFCPGAQPDTSSNSSSSGSNDTYDWYFTLIGIVLILAAQFLQAFQTILEEQFLHDIKAPVTFIVGLEGLYGLIICSIMMPIMGMSWVPEVIAEDTKDTFVMLGNTLSLSLITVGYVISILMFNYSGMMITDYVNAMVRNVMEPMRMITIWICSVFLYYVVDPKIGEKVGWFTFIEVFGFIFLTGGFLLYTRVIKIQKLFKYPPPEPEKEEGKDDEVPKGDEESPEYDEKEPLI